MMRWSCLLILLLPLAAGSCANKPAGPTNQATANAAKPALANATAAPVAAADSATPIPPKGAQFTIYCKDYVGSAHVDQANRAKSELMKNSGMRGWYVIHQEDRSTLCYGYYQKIQDPQIAQDRKAIDNLTDKLGDHLFRGAFAVEIDAPDPTAPPEWNLATVRQSDDDLKHYWSLQIAAYKDSPERKKAAVDMVRDARSRGVDAYFFHGPTVSSVCIGVWPKDAVTQEDSTVETSSASEEERVMVSPVPLPPNVMREASRKNITVRQPTFEIANAGLRQAMEMYPQHYVNGLPEGITLKGKTTPKHSMVVQIPVSAPSALGGIPAVAPPPPDAVRSISPGTSTTPGGGRLRGIGG